MTKACRNKATKEGRMEGKEGRDRRCIEGSREREEEGTQNEGKRGLRMV